jgi:hypothetical protein
MLWWLVGLWLLSPAPGGWKHPRKSVRMDIRRRGPAAASALPASGDARPNRGERDDLTDGTPAGLPAVGPDRLTTTLVSRTETVNKLPEFIE